MNFEENLKIINKIIENELTHVQNENFKGMDNLDKYNKLIKERDDIFLLLMKALPKESQKILTRFCDIYEFMSLYETEHYFKKGVSAGTSNLNFLRDLSDGVIFY